MRSLLIVLNVVGLVVTIAAAILEWRFRHEHEGASADG